jgi:GGDEF domain-containing protein
MPAVEDGSDFRAERVAPWTAAIDRRLGRHAADGRPFAVLCVELADVERLTAGDLDPDTTGALEDLEAAVLSQLRPADALVRERAGRYWLTTPDTDAADARALAHRIAGAVAELPPHRGTPLQVAVGVTTCPADGTDAATLEGRAEEGVFSARASGTRVAEPPPA